MINEKNPQGFIQVYISRLTFLTSLFTLPNKVIQRYPIQTNSWTWKKLKAWSCTLSWRTALKDICRQWWGQYTVLLGPIPALEAGAHLGGGKLCCLFSVPAQTLQPNALQLFPPALCFLTPSLVSAVVHSRGFWTQSSSQTRDKPSPRIRFPLWSLPNLSLSTPSLPGFPSQFLCQTPVSPPQGPQWHSSLFRSASHFPWLQLLISLPFVSLSAPFLSA